MLTKTMKSVKHTAYMLTTMTLSDIEQQIEWLQTVPQAKNRTRSAFNTKLRLQNNAMHRQQNLARAVANRKRKLQENADCRAENAERAKVYKRMKLDSDELYCTENAEKISNTRKKNW